MPLFKNLWNISDELLDELRSRFLKEVRSRPEESENYHPHDIRRVEDNDWYIARYLLHTDFDVDAALKMLKESLKFRKDMEVNTIKKKDLPREYFNVRAVIPYNKDNKEHPIVVVRSKTHIKKEETRRLQQQYMLYWVEKGVRAANWGAVTIIFDCTDAGVRNMDIDMIRFILNTFKKYYPWGLGYFLVYNMPWYLSAFWRMIKQWIPEKHASRICIVDCKSIREFIDEDQLPVACGGTCTKLYEPKEGAEETEDSDEEFIAAS